MIQAIVFSNNSPNFLDIFLQSAKDNEISIFDFTILYNTLEVNEYSYKKVFYKYGISKFVKETSFKENLMSIIGQDNTGLISFFKDTNYFFSKLPMFNIEEIMSDENMFCFSLGLGRNIKQDFNNNVENILIEEECKYENTIQWNWVKHYLSFGRPLELGSGHIFHKKEIAKMFKKSKYNSIQSLEESFEAFENYPKELMSSFENSVLVDIFARTEDFIDNLNAFDFSKLEKQIIEI